MSKKRFEVQEKESIEECLARMKQEGYSPVKRIEKPLFKEVVREGRKDYEPVAAQIVFEGKRLED
ncbi:NETI motif-containing protein [Bacillus sp. 2205SS5-2]|uniref:NETI motif-containing protein n=1 Tax=Bacillus sp. 2205SS5-2 TaxID=3109031 RepID=UPI003007E01B